LICERAARVLPGGFFFYGYRDFYEECGDFYEGEGLGESGVVKRELPWVTGRLFFYGSL
jgi:hypothetical protein